jgi:hypothetical protein
MRAFFKSSFRGFAASWWLIGALNAWAAPPGTVTFANNSSSKIINGLTGAAVTLSDNVQAALYWAPAGSSSFKQLGAAIRVGNPLSGLFAAGTRMTGSATAGGATAQFQVRAWGGGYPTFEQAQVDGSVLLGWSAILLVATGNPGAGPPMPPNSLIGLNTIVLTPGGLQWLTLVCASNKTAVCSTAWDFDEPAVIDTCTNSNVNVSILSTVTNGTCPQIITRTWEASDACNRTSTCFQTITVAMPPSSQIVNQVDGTLELVYTVDPGLTYQLQYKINLDQYPWTNLGNPVTATNATVMFNDSVGPDSQRFYRILLLPVSP